MPNSLRVVARLKARPDKVTEFRSVLIGLLAPTRNEPGCVNYEILENREDPAEFTLVEEWSDEAALEAHRGTAHMQHARGKFPDLLAAEPDVRRYNALSAPKS